MENNNLKIFLMFWSLEKQIILLLPVHYNMSTLFMVKYSIFLKVLAKVSECENLIFWSGEIL
jgi:hypothetical protein